MLGQTSPDKRGAEGYRRPPSLSFHWLLFLLSFLLVWVVSCGGCSCVSLHTRKRYTFSHKFSSCYPLRQQPGPLTLGFYIITFAFFEGIEFAPVLGNQCLQSMNILNESWNHYFFCRCNNNAWLTQTNLFPLVVLLFFSSGDITLSILWKLNMKRNLIFYYHVCSLLLVVELQSLGDPRTLAEICRRAKCHSLDLLCIVSQNCSLNLAAVNEVRPCGIPPELLPASLHSLWSFCSCGKKSFRSTQAPFCHIQDVFD